MSYSELNKNFQRLGLLENAVKNYSDGIERLIERVSLLNGKKRDLPADVKLFLLDIERYLTDVAIAGQLDNEIVDIELSFQKKTANQVVLVSEKCE